MRSHQFETFCKFSSRGLIFIIHSWFQSCHMLLHLMKFWRILDLSWWTLLTIKYWRRLGYFFIGKNNLKTFQSTLQYARQKKLRTCNHKLTEYHFKKLYRKANKIFFFEIIKKYSHFGCSQSLFTPWCKIGKIHVYN